MSKLRERTTATLLIAIFMISTIASVILAIANTTVSSTMEFEGTLTDEGGGIYSGVIPMIVDGDYDVYAKEGDSAWFGDLATTPIWTEVTISDHDGWPGFDPDTPDWYQYSLELSYDAESGEYKWAIRNHPGATAAHPWYDTTYWGSEKPPCGVPMSGTIVLRNDGTSYAYETDIGYYITGTPEIPGGAVLYGGGAACWDMDWSWGSEVVPLEYPGFEIEVTGTGSYQVTMTPARARGPTPVIIPIHQTQLQWRAYAGMDIPFGTWSGGYDNSHQTLDFSLSGNVLHGEWTYSPAVTEGEGASSIWVYNKKDDVWINKEGTVTYKYVAGYGDYTAVNYFRGYVEFSGTPGPGTFEHGVAYQWIYVYEPYDNQPTEEAHWDSVMGAWLVGYSIYIWDPQSVNQEYWDPNYNWVFAEPVPARNYNPEDL